MYKVWVQADSTGTWATNGLEFDSQEKANDYGRGSKSKVDGCKGLQGSPAGG